MPFRVIAIYIDLNIVAMVFGDVIITNINSTIVSCRLEVLSFS